MVLGGAIELSGEEVALILAVVGAAILVVLALAALIGSMAAGRRLGIPVGIVAFGAAFFLAAQVPGIDVAAVLFIGWTASALAGWALRVAVGPRRDDDDGPGPDGAAPSGLT